MTTELLEQYIADNDLYNLKRLLTENAALAKTITSHKVSPLMLSCYFKKPQISALLLDFVGEISFFEAAAVGKLEVVEQNISAKPELINAYAPDGFTALGLACYFGRPDVVRYLIAKGADVNQPSNNGFQVFPIHSSTAGNFTEITRVLIDAGAKVNVKQQAGSTPLHAAAQNGNLDMLILLLEHGAQVHTRMEGGRIPADMAREKGFNDIADILS